MPNTSGGAPILQRLDGLGAYSTMPRQAGRYPGALQRHLELDAVQAAALQLTIPGQLPVGFYLFYLVWQYIQV